MIDLPTKAEVDCSDGVAGRSTYVIGSPATQQLTHLVVKSYRPPFQQYLVPIDQVVETTPDRIKLKCTRDDLTKMKPFEYEDLVWSEVPGHARWADTPALPVVTADPVQTNVPVIRKNIPEGEIALQRGARVEATDSHLGEVDELLIDSETHQVTHLILLESKILTKREITIPISEIDRIKEDVIYLKLDRQSVEMLPTAPEERWPEHLRDTRLEREIKMDKILVIVFDSETQAYEGSKALQELQNEGSISLYAKAVVAKDASGKMAVKQKADMGPIGTAVGLVTGSLIGMFGGPVGLAVGFSAGTFGGLVYDLAHLGVGQDFLIEVEKSLEVGKAAVVAEVWEEWTTPVDTRMEALGGTVIRRTRRDVLEDAAERDIAALKADVAELEAERDQATGEARAKLQAKVDAANAKLKAAQDEFNARNEASKNEAEAKIQSLQNQAAKDSEERNAKREARIAELKADHKRRSDALKEKWEKTKDSLSK